MCPTGTRCVDLAAHDGRFRAYVGPGAGTPFTVVVEGRDRSDPQTLDVFVGAAIDADQPP